MELDDFASPPRRKGDGIRFMEILAYRKPDPPRRRQRALILIGAVLLVIFLFNEVPSFLRRLQLLYWQHQCMTFSAPADAVVWQYSRDLRREPPMQRGYVDAPTIDPNAIGRTPLCMLKFLGLTARFPAFGYGVIFLHQRQSHSGLRRLVMVEVFSDKDCTFPVDYQAVVPGTILNEPVFCLDTQKPSPPITGIPQPRVFFAGQIDPRDESKFTIGYEWNDGVRREISGYLGDDGNIHMSVKKGDLDGEMKRVRQSVDGKVNR